MNHNHTHKEVPGGKKLCPACFFAVQGDEVFFGPEIPVHAFAGCLMQWARMTPEEQRERAAEAARLADPGAWTYSPLGEGRYWAKREGSDVMSNVTVLRGVHGFVVKCGQTLQEMAALRGYLFSPKGVCRLTEAA